MAKILLVDDNLDVRNFCYVALSKKGHQVITAARGGDALSMIDKEKMELVLLDLKLSGEDGLDILKKIRIKYPKLPVALFSGVLTPEIEKEAYEAGAVECLVKDTGFKNFIEKIEKVLSSTGRIFSDKDSGRKEKILVVDDDDNVRHLLIEFFSRKGFQTIGAENGEKAIELVKSENPTVMLLDITMPGMDGILTLKKIREFNKDIGVVMATAIQDEDIAKQATALGAYSYVIKPFDLKYLELVVLTRLVIAS